MLQQQYYITITVIAACCNIISENADTIHYFCMQTHFCNTMEVFLILLTIVDKFFSVVCDRN